MITIIVALLAISIFWFLVHSHYTTTPEQEEIRRRKNSYRVLSNGKKISHLNYDIKVVNEISSKWHKS